MKINKWMAWILGVVCCLGSTAAARADVKLPRVFSDHMVLQQKAEVAIWGTADPGEEIAIALGEAKSTAKAGADGKWTAKLATPAAGGPFELLVKGKNEIKVSDVLVGEVWVASGQSNMEWTVAISANPQQESAEANYPQIRMLNVAKAVAEQPASDIQGAWAVCSPQTAPGFSAVGYYFARHLHKELKVPVGIINSSWGGTICEAWTSREALAADPDFKPILDRAAKFQPGNPNQAAALYNGMLAPVIPFGIRGAIWYQGESNVGRAVQYRKLFPAMIGDWRKRFGQGDFPFLYVQLAPFKYGHNPALLPEQWESQLKTLALTNTGMCVTTDITGDVNDIHPKNKQDVGKRLALWALAKTYGQESLVYSGPLYDSMAVEGNKIRIKFKHAAGGLVAEGNKPLSDFSIAGADLKFVPATAMIDGETVVVSHDQVTVPTAVRFAWSETAVPNLFNKEKLPASPFRTDEGPLATANNK